MTRSRASFTEPELETIRCGFRDNRPAKDVAADLGCSPITIQGHYTRLRRAPKPSRKPALGAARFYKSDFVPS